jgi:ubiquinone/menaquinone biosynthesis C-methylase UbiE
MTNKANEKRTLTASDARFAAQRLAFGPLVFHATLGLRDLGILEALMKRGDAGATVSELAGQLDLSRYALTVLLESGLGADIVSLVGDRYTLTKVGYFVLYDEMTRVNLNFVRDICYQGGAELVTSLLERRPAGLKHLGPWRTIYEGIGSLPEPERSSWFEFDHYYSSSAFPDAVPLVFARPVQTLLDVGGNTGKFAVICARERPAVRVTVLDAAPQVEQALARAAREGVADRVFGEETDLLDHERSFPAEFDAVWMSQLLSCFSPEDIIPLLRKSARSLTSGGSLFILETFWDRQKYPAAAYNLQQTSLYFASMANGVSRIYDYASIADCIAKAGLAIDEVVDGLGVSHTLLRCSVSG